MIAPVDKTYGSLLGLVLGDALGARFEGLERKQLHDQFSSDELALEYAMKRESLRYTDDGQMALALAEFLTANEAIDSAELMQCFVESYESWRGYGRGARVLIEAFRDSADYEFMAEHLFPGGSLGNGAAMRSAPVGLRFANASETIRTEAKKSAWPTHRHVLGIEGAQLIALATAYGMNQDSVTPASLADFLLPSCSTIVFQNRIERLAQIETSADIEQFGNGVEAHESVVTALACFALCPKDYPKAIASAIWQGGDTDTIAAMTGALVGAHSGPAFSNAMPLERLEDGQGFVEYVRELSLRLSAKSQ